jgi:hypothetical protein
MRPRLRSPNFFLFASFRFISLPLCPFRSGTVGGFDDEVDISLSQLAALDAAEEAAHAQASGDKRQRVA